MFYYKLLPFHFSVTCYVWRELPTQVTRLIKQFSLVLGSDKVENHHYKGYSWGPQVLRFRFYIYSKISYIQYINKVYTKKPQKFTSIRKLFLLKNNHNLLKKKKVIWLNQILKREMTYGVILGLAPLILWKIIYFS